MCANFQIGEFAKANNTKLSVLAVEGQETGLQHVQQCAIVSGGTINVLNPLEMMRQLRLIAQNYIIATAVDVTVVLHRDLTFDEERFLQVTIFSICQSTFHSINIFYHIHYIPGQMVVLISLDFFLGLFVKRSFCTVQRVRRSSLLHSASSCRSFLWNSAKSEII